MKTLLPLPSQEEIRRLMDYEPDTGLMRWRYRSNKGPRWNARFVGAVAGYVALDNRRTIRVNGQAYIAARLAWVHVHGAIPPGLLIDHINRNPLDDRLVNLRLATCIQNQGNVGLNSRNTSGIKGVSWNKREGRWCAAIRINKRTTTIGHYDTKEEAGAAYARAARVHFGEFFCAETTRAALQSTEGSGE